MLKIIAILLPIATVIIAFVKKMFGLTGWAVRLTGLIIAAILSIGYGVVNSLLYYHIIALTLGLWLSTCGAYDWLKEFIGWLRGRIY